MVIEVAVCDGEVQGCLWKGGYLRVGLALALALRFGLGFGLGITFKVGDEVQS